LGEISLNLLDASQEYLLYKEFLEKLTPNDWKEAKKHERMEKRRLRKESQQVKCRTNSDKPDSHFCIVFFALCICVFIQAAVAPSQTSTAEKKSASSAASAARKGTTLSRILDPGVWWKALSYASVYFNM